MEERRGEIEGAILRIVKLCDDAMFCFNSKYKVVEKSPNFDELDQDVKNLILTKGGKLKQSIVSPIKESIRTIILRKGKERFLMHIIPFCGQKIDKKKEWLCLCSIYPYRSVEGDGSERKRDFLRIMAHELKSPLANLGLYIDFILNECRKENKGRLKNIFPFVKKMKRQTFQIITMIDNYLDMSKFKENIFELSLERFSLNELINEIKELSEPLFFAKDVKFKVVKGKNLPVEIESDSEMIKRILINFIANAVKFTESGRVLFKTEIANREVSFSVSDTGCGIEKEEFQKIFKPYHRGKNVGKRPPGFGLGLAIAKSMATLLKGSIEIKSKVNEGSTFTLKIPIYEES